MGAATTRNAGLSVTRSLSPHPALNAEGCSLHGESRRNAPNAIIKESSSRIDSMQEVFNRYINYLQAERNASPYTVRNYVNDLVGNYARGPEKGFFQFLKPKKIGSLNEVDHKTIRAYIAWLMEQGPDVEWLCRVAAISFTLSLYCSSTKIGEALVVDIDRVEIGYLLEQPLATVPMSSNHDSQQVCQYPYQAARYYLGYKCHWFWNCHCRHR